MDFGRRKVFWLFILNECGKTALRFARLDVVFVFNLKYIELNTMLVTFCRHYSKNRF